MREDGMTTGAIELFEAGLQRLRIDHAAALLASEAPKLARVGVVHSDNGALAEVFNGCASEVITAGSECASRITFALVDPPFNIGEPYDGFQDNAEPAVHAARIWGIQTAIADAVNPSCLIAWHVPEAMLFTEARSSCTVAFW